MSSERAACDDEALAEPLRRARYRRCAIYEAAEWYDVDYAGYRGEEAFYKLVGRELLGSSRAMVELGAGTGRLTVPLAQEGLRIVAVEPASGMRARLEARVQAQPSLSVVVQAGTAADFVCTPAPHLVIFPFNGMLHLDSLPLLRSSLTHIHEQLAPNGRFAFDVTGPYWDAIAYGPVPWGRSDERVHPVSGLKVFTADRSRYDPASRMMHIDIRYVVEGETEGVEVALVQRMWTYQQLLRAVLEAGFVIELLFGDVDMAPFSEGAVRMLLCARKT